MTTNKRNHKEKNNNITPQRFFLLQWRVFIELLSERKKWTIGIISFSILVAICGFIEVKFIEYVTDSVYLFYSGVYLFKDLFVIFLFFFLLLIIVRLLKNKFQKTSAQFDSYVSLLIDKKITNKISKISYEYFETMEFYEKIHLAAKASSQYPNAIYGVIQIINIISSLIVYCIILSKVSIKFIFVVMASILIGSIISLKTTDLQLSYWRKNVSPEERKNDYFKNIYSSRINQSNIQTNNAHVFFRNKYHEYNTLTRKNYLKLNGMSFFTELFVALLFVVAFCYTTLTVGTKVVQGELNLGYYSMVVAALSNLFLSIKKFVKFMNSSNWYVRVLEAYYDVLDFEDDEPVLTDLQYAETCHITLNDVSYKYAQSEKEALRELNLQFLHNQKIAIVGANGSGKSTCVLIVLGLLKKYTGIFNSDNVVVSAILQDFGKYQMTIKQNIEIGVGGKNLSDATIKDLLNRVGLLDFVMSKPKGIYTMLGQLNHGENLSVGQWQRLAIARLLANDKANVWILDEPTAHLDPIAEIEIYKLIFELSKNKLVIFISHRLGFSKMADKVIVFNKGQISEIGTHSQLMMNNGIYKQMFDIQKEMYQ